MCTVTKKTYQTAHPASPFPLRPPHVRPGCLHLPPHSTCAELLTRPKIVLSAANAHLGQHMPAINKRERHLRAWESSHGEVSENGFKLAEQVLAVLIDAHCWFISVTRSPMHAAVKWNGDLKGSCGKEAGSGSSLRRLFYCYLLHPNSCHLHLALSVASDAVMSNTCTGAGIHLLSQHQRSYKKFSIFCPGLLKHALQDVGLMPHWILLYVANIVDGS